MQNAGLDEAQAEIKIAGRNINNLRYADNTTLMAESEEELKSLLMKVKENCNFVCTDQKYFGVIFGSSFFHTSRPDYQQILLALSSNTFRIHPWLVTSPTPHLPQRSPLLI